MLKFTFRLRICDLRLRARSGAWGVFPQGRGCWVDSAVGETLQVRALAEPQWIDGRFVDVRLQSETSF